MFQDFIIFNPIFSAIASIIFFNGIYFTSKQISNFKYFYFLKNHFSNTNFILFIFLLNLLAIIFYLFFLFFFINILLLQIISCLFIFLGLFNIFNFSFKKWKVIFEYFDNFHFCLFFFIIILYFFLTLSPITDPDSLEYHIGVPIYSLKHGYFFIKDYWLHSQLAGAGEAFNTLALSLHLTQTTTFVQFISILLILSVIHFSKSKHFLKIPNNAKYFIYLSIISCPVFLFLGNTAKPQLFVIATSFVAFFLTFILLPVETKNENKKKLFLLIVFLTLCTTQFKYSFFLSCGTIILFAFYEMYKARLIFFSILIFSILFSFIVVPREIYDYLYLNKNILVNFFYPISDPYLYETIQSSLRHGVGLSRNFPYWLIFPIKLKNITYSLGLGMLMLFFNFSLKKNEVKNIIYALIIFFALGLYLGQPTGRFFVEPFLWIILAASINFKFFKGFLYKIFYLSVSLQAIAISIILTFAVYSFFPGVISKQHYLNVLSKFADGYKIYNWSNKNLPKESILLTTHRSVSLSNRKTISTGFRYYYATDSKDIRILKYYLDLLKKEKPTHILYVEHEHNAKKDVFIKCRGEILKFKENAGQFAVRNIFNKDKNKYDGFIYKINYQDLDKC